MLEGPRLVENTTTTVTTTAIVRGVQAAVHHASLKYNADMSRPKVEGVPPKVLSGTGK